MGGSQRRLAALTQHLRCTAPAQPGAAAAAPIAGVVRRWLAGLFGSGDTDAAATGVKTIHFIRHGHATSNVAVEKVMAEHGIPHDQINSVLSVRAALTNGLFFVRRGGGCLPAVYL